MQPPSIAQIMFCEFIGVIFFWCNNGETLLGDFPWCKVRPRFSELFLRGGDCMRSGKLCPPKLQKSMQIPAPCKFGPAKPSFCSHPPTQRLPKRVSIPSPVPIKFASARSSFLLASAHEMLAQQKTHTNPISNQACIRKTLISARVRPQKASPTEDPYQPQFKSSLHLQTFTSARVRLQKACPSKNLYQPPVRIKLASAKFHF